MFSDEYALEFSELGNQMTRNKLDNSGHNPFWKRVCESYTDTTKHNELQHANHKFEGIDPSEIVVHSPKKLQSMWHEMHRQYKHVHSKYTQSGNHDPDFLAAVDLGTEQDDFINFCERPVLLYLRKCLKLRPNLCGFVQASLPDIAKIDTIGKTLYCSPSSTPSQSPSNFSSVSKRTSSLANAISEIANPAFRAEKLKMQSDLKKQEIEDKKKWLETSSVLNELKVQRMEVENRFMKEEKQIVFLSECLADENIDEEERQIYLKSLKKARLSLLEKF